MITVYLLKNCPACKSISTYINEFPSINICIIYVSHMNYPGLNKFPCAFNSLPNKNGLPKENSTKLTGSTKILTLLKNNNKKNNNFGNSKIMGNEIEINYDNISPLQNISQKMNSCFNGNCNTRLDRPYGPCDNKYLLDNSQPTDALPNRSHIPVANYGKLKPKKSKSKLKPKKSKNKLKPKKSKSKLKPKKSKCKIKCDKKNKKNKCKVKCNKKILTTPLGIELYIN